MKRFFKFGSPSFGVTNKTSNSDEVDSISAPNWPSRSGRDLYAIDVLSNRDRLFTKLHKACWTGDLEKVRKSIKRTDVNDVDCEMRTPLHLAAARAHKDIIWFLLGSKAKPNFPDRDGNTPLLKAVQSHRMDIVQFLLDRGGDPNAANLLGATALHIAAQDGLQDVASALLRNGAAVNAIDQNGCTPLLIATMKAHLDVAETLLSHGASVNIADKKQRTCLMLACEKGSTDMVQLYLDHGGQVASSSSQGMTAEDFARRSGHDACLKLLSSSSTARKADPTDRPIVDHSPDFKSVDLDSWNDDDDVHSTRSNAGPEHAAIKVFKTGFDMSKFFDENDADSLSNESVGSNKSVILDGNATLQSVISERVETQQSEPILATASTPQQLSPGPPPAPAKPKRAQSMESCVSVMDNLDFLPPVASPASANAAIEIANKRVKDLMAELGLSDVSQFSSSDQSSVKDEDTDCELDFRGADDETKPLEIELTAFVGSTQMKDGMEEDQEQDQRLLAVTDFKIEATISPIVSKVVEPELEEKVSKEDSDWLEFDNSHTELIPNSQRVDSKLKAVTKIDTGSNTVISSGFKKNNEAIATVTMTSSDFICLRDIFGESAAAAKDCVDLKSEQQKTQLPSKSCVSSTDGTLGRVDTLQGADEIWLRNPCRAIPIDLGSRIESVSSSSGSQRSSTTPQIDATSGGIFRAELVTLTSTANSKEDDMLFQTPPSKVVVPTRSDDWDRVWLRICGKLPMDGSDSIEESLAVDLEKNGKSAMASSVMDVMSMTALQNLQELSSPEDQSSLSLTDDQTYRLLVSMALVDPTPTSSIHRLASMIQHLRRVWLSEQAHSRDAEETISRLRMDQLSIKVKNTEANSALMEQKSKVAEFERELDAAKRLLDVEGKRTCEALQELDKRREQLEVAEAKYVEEASERQKAALRARAAELQAENIQLMFADEAARINAKHSSEVDDLIAEIASLRHDLAKVRTELARCQDNLKTVQERLTMADLRSAESEVLREAERVRLTEALRCADENLAEVAAQLAAIKVREEQLGGQLEDERADFRNAQEIIRNLEGELKKITTAANNLQAGHIVDSVIPSDDAITNNDVKNKNARRLQGSRCQNIGELTSTSHPISMMRNAKKLSSFTDFDLMDEDDDDYVAEPMASSFQNRSVEGGVYCPTHSRSSWYKLREDGVARSLEDEDRRDPSSNRSPAANSRRFDVQPKSSMSVDHRNCVDRSELDMMRQQLELTARNEMNRKLEQINDILEERTKSYARLDRSNSQLRGIECAAAIRELQSEVDRLHRSLEWSDSRHAQLEQHCGRLCELIEAKRRVKSKLRRRTDELDGAATSDGVEDRDCRLNHRHVCPIFDFEKVVPADNLRGATSSFLSSSAVNFYKNDLRNSDSHRADLGGLKFGSHFIERNKEPIFELRKPLSVNLDARKPIKPTSSSTFNNSLKRKFM